MNVDVESEASTRVEEFRNAHKVWKEANDGFHDRFHQLITRDRGHDIDALALDLASKFDHFIRCSKQLISNHVPE